MAETVRQLYPDWREHSVRGLYLAHRLHELGRPGLPFVYGNFVSTWDGRIALHDARDGESRLPEALTSGSDFRLLLELHAQADCLITHGGYMRAIAQRRLDDLLQVGTIKGHEDVTAWRAAGSTGDVLAFNAVLPSAGTPAMRPSTAEGTVRGNVTCASSQACFDKAFAPAAGGPLVGAAGSGPEPWRPTDDFTDALRTGPADVGAIELTGTGSPAPGSPGTAGPTITITKQTVTNRVLTLAGRASGTALTRIVWGRLGGNSGWATGTTSWTVPEIPLAIGKNVVTATVWDAAGRHQTVTLNITVR